MSTDLAPSSQPVSRDTEVLRGLDTFLWTEGPSGYLRDNRSGASLFAPAFVVQLAMACEGFAPLQRHVARYLSPFKGIERFKLFRAMVRHQMEAGGAVGNLQVMGEAIVAELAQKGFLKDRAGFLAALAEAAGPEVKPPPIQTLAIPTANRPELLKRALDSYLTHLKKNMRDIRILVSDDSRDAGTAAKNRAAASEAAATYGMKVEYLGSDERRALIDTHAHGRDDRRKALEFLLTDSAGLPQSFGLPRNAILLATKGQQVLCVDDDTLCKLFVSNDQRPGVQYDETGISGALGSTLEVSHDAALAAVRAYDGDVLAVHEKLLGRQVAAVMVEQGPLGGLSTRAYTRLRRASTRVAMTCTGLVGDRGGVTDPTLALLNMSGHALQQALSQGTLGALAKSREVVKVPDWAHVGSADSFMTTFYGHDNRTWSVPFFPYFRGEDQLFKEMLVRTDVGAEIGYLPVALEHAPVNASRPAPAEVLMLDVLLAPLADLARPSDVRSVGDRAREIGQRMLSFATQPMPAYRSQVLALIEGFSVRDRARQQDFLRQHRAALPPDLSEKLTASIDTLEKLLTRKDIVLAEPPVLEKAGSAPAAEALTRDLLRQMGEATMAMAE